MAKRILITGAGGFIGGRLASAILADGGGEVTLLDTVPIEPTRAQARIVQGDLADPHIIDAAIGDGVDLVYHLAGVVGPAAEADYSLARRVNVDATLSLFERLRDSGTCPRVVYASSIAVFGEPPPPAVDDRTVPRPTLVYGAQKHMMEIALAQFSARGWLDGLSLRLPAVVAKPAGGPGTRTVFLNRIFHAYAAGEDMTVPVSPAGTLWLLSTAACIAGLVRAGTLPTGDIVDCRTITLPALRVTIGDLIAALARRYPDSRSRIDFAPDAVMEAQFASQPPLETPAAERLGFRHDGDTDTLVLEATNR